MATSTKTMVHRLALTKARINLGQVVRRVHLNKEYVILEKDGIPVAGMMNAEELEDYLELQDPGIKKQIAEGYAAYRRGETREAREFLDELKSELSKKKKRNSKKS